MPRVLCIGDLMLDIVVVIDREISVGGDTKAIISTHGGGAAANVATWLVDQGVDAYLASRVGDDANGRELHLDLDRYGVGHSEKRISGEKSGMVVVIVDKNFERTMYPDSGSNSHLSEMDIPHLSAFDAVFLSGYALLNEKSRASVEAIIRKIRDAGIPIVLDPGTVGAFRDAELADLHKWISWVDLLTLNEEEALYLGESDDLDAAITNLLKMTAALVIKRGSEGAVAQNRNSEKFEISAEGGSVVDTTGAGDAFTAGFIKEWVEGNSLDKALSSATKAATRCIAFVGARPPRNLKSSKAADLNLENQISVTDNFHNQLTD